ncbi:hypothetical protein C8J56DRAFT_1043447 [Mycena floridula]|nr:hypothetical protein C8J56DRAFT_1043447 [Mycena floridula]
MSEEPLLSSSSPVSCSLRLDIEPMPPKRAVPDFVDVSDDKKKILCRRCNAVSPSPWMLWKSFPDHLESRAHKHAVAAYENRLLTRQIMAETQQEADNLAASSDSRLVQPDFPEPRTTRTNEISAAEKDMWASYDPKDFDVGMAEDDDALAEAVFEKAMGDFGLWNAEALGAELGAGLDAEDEEQAMLADEDELVLNEMLENLDFIDELDEHGNSPEWYPYESKTMFLLDTLDNLPRLRVSASLMKVFIWVLRESGAKNVPTLHRLRQAQKSFRKSSSSGVPTIPCTTVRGNLFHMNDPRSIIAMDWNNPLVRQHIHVYPEIPPNGVVSELWHAEKWRKDMDLNLLSPMYDAGHLKHFYVNEVAMLKKPVLLVPRPCASSFVIPIRWVMYQGKVHADAFIIYLDSDRRATVDAENTYLVNADQLDCNFIDLQDQNLIPNWSEQSMSDGYPAQMPNPDRKIANGAPFYTSFVDYFCDDVSGNRSKSWNKHWNAYMTHRNLPREMLQQEFHVHFISTSQHVTVGEQFDAFKNVVQETHQNPMRVHDVKTGDETCVRIGGVNANCSDNPMQSEVTSHIGDKGNHPCRKCDVGGPQALKQENEGQLINLKPGSARDKETILVEVKKQVKLACLGQAKPIKDMQTDTGVKDAYTQYWIEDILKRFSAMCIDGTERTESEITAELLQWVDDNYDKIFSPFITLRGLDPTKDTPVEILHTILLGILKYIWHYSHTQWNDTQKKTYALRLQATETTGLSIQAIRAPYIMQYANSLIGRQLKTLLQANVFHVYDLVDNNHFVVWKAVGELGALLWHPEIDNMDQYCADLRIAVANVLDGFAAIDPSKMIMKIKLHLLAHLPEDAQAFGPLVGVATEVFEAFNGVFRFASVLSNHISPSRDIAIQLADQEGLKHRATGGWWNIKDDNAKSEWKQAGTGVRDFLEAQPSLQKLLGWSKPELWESGSLRLLPVPKAAKGQPRITSRPVVKLFETAARNALNIASYPVTSLWMQGKHVTAKSGDLCPVGSWVFTISPHQAKDTIVGCIKELLVECSLSGNPKTTGLVILEQFHVGGTRHPTFDMPTLGRRHGEESITIIPSTNVLFIFNVQHDCREAKCIASGTRPVVQERKETTRQESFIEHKPLQRYIINMTALHNAHLLRRTLPRELAKPIALRSDAERRIFHDQQATILRATRTKKADERKEKREKKKLDKAKEVEAAKEQNAGHMLDDGGDAEHPPASRKHRHRKAVSDDDDDEPEQPQRQRRRGRNGQAVVMPGTSRTLRPRVLTRRARLDSDEDLGEDLDEYNHDE